MPSPKNQNPAHSAILRLAEVKQAVEVFERGESNVFECLDAVMIAIDAYRAAAEPRRKAA